MGVGNEEIAKKTSVKKEKRVFTERTKMGVMLNMTDSLDNIKTGVSGSNDRTWRDVVGGDDLRNTVEFLLAVDAGEITKEELKEGKFLEDDNKKLIKDVAGDLSLHMSGEPVQNERLKSMTQRAQSVAKELTSRGVTQENWESAVKTYSKATTAGL